METSDEKVAALTNRSPRRFFASVSEHPRCPDADDLPGMGRALRESSTEVPRAFGSSSILGETFTRKWS